MCPETIENRVDQLEGRVTNWRHLPIESPRSNRKLCNSGWRCAANFLPFVRRFVAAMNKLAMRSRGSMKPLVCWPRDR